MNILVVNGHSLHKRFDLPGLYHHHAPEAAVTMICSAKYGYGSAKNYEGYRQVYTIENFEANPEVERIARQLCRQGVDRVVAGNERDILTAARLRTQFGFPGQQLEQALLFRDKAHMRRAARENGFLVPHSTVVQNAMMAYAFAENHGFPLLLKPRRGASSLGIQVLKNECELTVALTKAFRHQGLDRDSELDFLMETVVQGDMYSVNGFIMTGSKPVIWPNKVLGSWLGLAQHGEAVFDYIMEPDAPECEALTKYARDLLTGFGLRDSVFHLEVFRRATDGQLLLCEVACRSPGLLIVDAWKKMFGLDLDEISFLLQTGLGGSELASVASAFDPSKRQSHAVGYLSIPCRNGLVVRAPSLSMDGVEFDKLILEGSQYSHTDQINSLAVLALLESDTYQSLREKCQAIEEWYLREVIWRE